MQELQDSSCWYNLLGDMIKRIGVTTLTMVTLDHGGLGLVNIKFNWYQILLLSISFQSSSLTQSILVSRLYTTCSSMDRLILISYNIDAKFICVIVWILFEIWWITDSFEMLFQTEFQSVGVLFIFGSLLYC